MTRKKITKEQERELLTNRFTAPFKVEVTGHVEVSEEERRKAREFAKTSMNFKIKLYNYMIKFFEENCDTFDVYSNFVRYLLYDVKKVKIKCEIRHWRYFCSLV